jgi:hypothetical protein
VRIRTNYDLCGMICGFIEETVPGELLTAHRNQYFGLYIFLMHKVLGVKMRYCKDLIAIYCNSYVRYAKTSRTPVDVYGEVLQAILAFNEAFELRMRERDSRNADSETLLKRTLDATARCMRLHLRAEEDEERVLELLQTMTAFIGRVSSALGVGE